MVNGPLWSRTLICLLCLTCFTCALRCAHSFASSLTHSLLSSWESELLDAVTTDHSKPYRSPAFKRPRPSVCVQASASKRPLPRSGPGPFPCPAVRHGEDHLKYSSSIMFFLIASHRNGRLIAHLLYRPLRTRWLSLYPTPSLSSPNLLLFSTVIIRIEH